jgi:hypothetical protein
MSHSQTTARPKLGMKASLKSLPCAIMNPSEKKNLVSVLSCFDRILEGPEAQACSIKYN